jgi:hypothetical protein
MNNSIERLVDGMIATLRREVIPATHGEFARGQAFGVIYMLESLKLRVDWSASYLSEQQSAWAELGDAVAASGLPEGLAPPAEAAADGDAWICEAYDWLAAKGVTESPLKAALDAYLHRCIGHEIRTSARPMFAEMSLGREREGA